MAGLEIRGLTRQFRAGARALDGVDFEVAPGELLVLVGPSGSGKTTLLRLVAGLEEPTAGEIRLGGKTLAGVPPHRRNVALVFQNLALYAHLTVADNLRFGLTPNPGDPKTTTDERIQWTAERLGIGRLLDRLPGELSGGEQQRVALGRAIVRQPAALLLDEPLSSLDAPTRRTLRRELKSLQRSLGVPTIYVTHDQAEALALGDRIAVLKSGKLRQIGTPDDVYFRPEDRFVGEFFGPEGMNVIAGELNGEGEVSGLCGDNFSVLIPQKHWPDAMVDGSVLLGIRPEDIVVGHGEPETYALEGEVDSIECVADSVYVCIRLGIHETLPAHREGKLTTIVARVPESLKTRKLRSGEKIHARMNYERIHWFNADGKAMWL